MTKQEALKIAYQQNLDLVLVSERSDTVICKIMDYQKHIYEEKLNKKQKNKPAALKELQLSLNTSTHDLEVRLKQAEAFLTKGSTVKIKIRFKGRESVYVDKGKLMLLNIADKLQTKGDLELSGKQLSITIRRVKNAKNEKS